MFFASFFPKIEQWSDTHNINKNKHYYSSHMPYLNSFFISFQYFAAKVQRKYESAKSLAEILVFLFVWKLTQESFFIHRLSTEFFLSTDYHRFTQIILISKDILIITDFYFWHGWTRLFQRHGYSSALILSRHFVVTACFASSRLGIKTSHRAQTLRDEKFQLFTFRLM